MSKVEKLNESENHKKAKDLIDSISKNALKQKKITNTFFFCASVFCFLFMHPLTQIISGYAKIEFNTAMMISIVISAMIFIVACKLRVNFHKKAIQKTKDEVAEKIKDIDLSDEALKRSKMSFIKN